MSSDPIKIVLSSDLERLHDFVSSLNLTEVEHSFVVEEVKHTFSDKYAGKRWIVVFSEGDNIGFMAIFGESWTTSGGGCDISWMSDVNSDKCLLCISYIERFLRNQGHRIIKFDVKSHDSYVADMFLENGYIVGVRIPSFYSDSVDLLTLYKNL